MIANSASMLSGSATARTTPSVSPCPSGQRAHGDERHFARVVDLRQPRQLAARQLPAGVEEAQPQVLGLQVLDEGPMLRLVLGADRSQHDRFALPVDDLRQSAG